MTTATSNLESYVRRVVEAAPPLTVDQRAKIASLLRPSGPVISAPLVVSLDD